MKKILYWIVIIILLLFTIGGIAYLSLKDQTKWNTDHVNGNTAGNLYNSGLFCEYNNQIYFSNPKDNGTLYSMDPTLSNYKKLSNDKVTYINASGNYLYYSRVNYQKDSSADNVLQFHTVGIYRTDLDGSNITTLTDQVAGMVHQYGNYLYFQSYQNGNGYSLERIKIDGSDRQKISSNPFSPGLIELGALYYSNLTDNHNIMKLDLLSQESTVVYEGNTSTILSDDEYYYYLSLKDNYQIMRLKKNEPSPTTIVPKRCCTFNVSSDGSYLYYQVDDGENNGLHRLNLDTMEDTELSKGNYCNINLTSDYVFYQKFGTNEFFVSDLGDDREVFSFQPEVK